jgi:hypothetical protein
LGWSIELRVDDFPTADALIVSGIKPAPYPDRPDRLTDNHQTGRVDSFFHYPVQSSFEFGAEGPTRSLFPVLELPVSVAR